MVLCVCALRGVATVTGLNVRWVSGMGTLNLLFLDIIGEVA